MSRTMPSECPHGAIYDWADFGCECGPHGTCLRDELHNAPQRCEHGCNDAFIAAPVPSEDSNQ